ncbi:MAG: hypothetical protein WDN01_17295 [Rhizomicrobium sp.]
MGAEGNKALIRHILNAYAQSDLGPLLSAIHPDIVWTSQSPAALFGFGGSHKGRAGALTEYYDSASLLLAEGRLVPARAATG